MSPNGWESGEGRSTVFSKMREQRRLVHREAEGACLRAASCPSRSRGCLLQSLSNECQFPLMRPDSAGYLSFLRDGGASLFRAFGKSFLNSALAFSWAASSRACSAGSNCSFGFTSGRLRLGMARPQRRFRDSVTGQDTRQQRSDQFGLIACFGREPEQCRPARDQNSSNVRRYADRPVKIAREA